ncbi:hypothetical protein KB206_00220 [Microvirga sp. STS02]|uniref:hypothetical protein n=1 Tax=Hymenobacter negativus TaxID=2795026 RepID=UPI0018DB0A57|nr:MULTISPECIES: hypothetical protein [Bacteria]MBH8567290.1 hypothetical protein [Hymenobacter negativus]MBR7207022.1 hypothetical protein [Microvirga sp. STS02]
MLPPAPKFTVERLTFATLTELPNTWQNADYKALLVKMNYDNPDAISEAELKEMCLMAFTDLEPREAAEVVLGYLHPEELTAGQVENLAHQMLTEKLWEENPELPLHKGFYQATQLLHDAFNGTFPATKAVEFQVKCTAEKPADLAVFDNEPAAPLMRLLASGLPDNALINRLFSPQVEGDKFEEAKAMLWQLTTTEKTENSITFDVVSSAYWLEDFKYADTYEATTHADAVVTSEE